MAKINIGLSVHRKRMDGYHELETLFYPIPFHDVLEVIPAQEDLFQIYGIPMNGPKEENLVWKALVRLRQVFEQRIPPVEVHLIKNIPMGAGLAGGSSDASMMLLLLNQVFELDMKGDQLRSLAAELGSDCPFFIHPRPCLARGRGEILEPIDLDLSNYDLYLLCPEFSISTAEAFAKIRPQIPPAPIRDLVRLPPDQWKDRIINDFESPLWSDYPELKTWKETLYEKGAIYVSLTGTGSTLYALVPKAHPFSLDSSFGRGLQSIRLPLDGRRTSP